jgi:hypothetical protein
MHLDSCMHDVTQWVATQPVEVHVEMDGRPKARREFHVSDTIRGYTYATTRVVHDTLYVITAWRVL